MLTSETKRHIDAARQVLVGVVPNPTSQIDQITNALIYKFMDDMDQAAIKQGDQPSFFVGDLERYAWTRLMDSRLGNQERMNLYSEALTKFSESKNLPELFRGIFKSAFLPYRSPDTLGMFLEEISHFDYSHPEELGNAYEYLLSIMSSQGDAGQFRTPRHIIDFIVAAINPTKEDRVLDPACGTGGFLVSSYKHILAQHDGTGEDGQPNDEKPLTPDDRRKLMGNFEGYDIDPGMVRIAQVNMYLHQFKNPKIFQYDTLSSEERWNDKFDVILANPPFMSPKGGIKPHSKFSVQSSRSEVLFADYIMNHLRPKGRAGIIVPEGIIFQSGKAHKQLRANLVKDGLYAVVSLPSGVFQPYAGVKTSVLLFDNELAKRSTEILFIKIENDGFDLGANKRVSDKNDLPETLKILDAWKRGEKIESTKSLHVEKAKIAESGDYNLSGDRYRIAADYTNAKWPMVKLGDVDIFQIESGGTPSSTTTKYWGGDINWATLVDLPASDIISTVTRTERTITKEGLNNSAAKLLPIDTILISSRATIGRIGIATVPLATNQGFKNIIVKNQERALPIFVAYMVLGLVPQMKSMSSGGTFKEISKSNFSKLEIPLPPLVIQKQIVAELDSYQSIITGAKQIVSNWKPKIDIDPEWPKVKLNEACEKITDGTHNSPEYASSGIPMLDSKDICGGYIDEAGSRKFISKKTDDELAKRCKPHTGDVLVSSRGSIGKLALVREGQNFNIMGNIILLRPLASLLPEYLYNILSYIDLEKESHGVAQKGLYLGTIKDIEISIPNLDIQKQIVARIESERTLVDSAKKLIDLYTAKTSSTIAKIWGE
ncbi:MAG: N-6 DNA methylase [Patescibacteria group bacterium]